MSGGRDNTYQTSANGCIISTKQRMVCEQIIRDVKMERIGSQRQRKTVSCVAKFCATMFLWTNKGSARCQYGNSIMHGVRSDITKHQTTKKHAIKVQDVKSEVRALGSVHKDAANPAVRLSPCRALFSPYTTNDTKFQSTLGTENLCSLLQCKVNIDCECYELSPSRDLLDSVPLGHTMLNIDKFDHYPNGFFLTIGLCCLLCGLRRSI